MMTTRVRNRLLLLGALWGLALSALPALVMSDPYRHTGFLLAALASAVLSGAVGTTVAGRRVARRASNAASEGAFARKSARSWLVSGVKTGAVQGLVGGAVAALLSWALIAVAISGFSMRDLTEPSALMSPRVFLGSFFVALSVFLYALAGGLLLGPLFRPLVERAVGRQVRGKEEPVVR